MTYSTPLTTLAMALALPAAALASVPGLATAAGASPDGGPGHHQAADGRITTTTTTGADHRSGRALGELTPEGPRPEGLGLTARPGGAAGGDARWPSASDSISAGPWCVYQCITEGVAYEHGDGARLVVETSVPAEIVLIVCRDDDADYDCEYLEYSSSWPDVTEHELVLDPLEPGTYWVTATATDSTGTSHAFGEFTLT
jgi:hypothetical protein